MDKDFLKKAITEQLGNLNDQIRALTKHENKIPQIEIDITMSNMRDLYEYIHALNKINQLPPGNGSQKGTTEKKSVEESPVKQKPAAPKVEKKIKDKPPAPAPC